MDIFLSLLEMKDASKFEIGFANEDIMPDWAKYKTKMGGYIRWRKYVSGVLDPLIAHAICIRHKTDLNRSMILISADLVGIQWRLSHLARQKISEVTGIPMSNILIHVTHSHSTPDAIGIFPVTIYNDAFFLDVQRHTAHAVIKGLAKAGIRAFRGANRSFLMGFGETKELTNFISVQRRPPYETLSEPIRFLKITDLQGHLLALLINYQGHPTQLPQINTKMSAEYPGQVVRAAFETFPDLEFATYFNGFCGDVSIKGYTRFLQHYHAGLSKDEAMEKAMEGLYDLGMEINSKIKEVLSTVPVEPLETLECLSRPILVKVGGTKPLKPRLKYYPTFVSKINAFIKDFKANLTFYALYRVLSFFRKDDFSLLRVIKDGFRLYHHTQYQVFKLNDFVIVGSPGEPFLKYQRYLDLHIPSKKRFFIEMANDTMGYIYPWTFHVQGGYEKTFGIDSTLGSRMFTRIARDLLKIFALSKSESKI